MHEDSHHEERFHEDTDPQAAAAIGDLLHDTLEMPLGDVPRRELLTVSPTTPIGEVIRDMNDRSIGCALIVDDGKLVGIFTERDVLRKVVAAQNDIRSFPVCEVMTARPDVLPAEATVAFALNRMSVEGYRHIPLVDEDGKPVGVVGMRDIINWIVELRPQDVLNIPPAPSSRAASREGA
jgi:CBS domain-containing protein